MIEDTELICRYAQERSEEAFSELVRRHIGLVYSVALRQTGGDRQLAEEVAQRVFTDLARKAGQLSKRATLSGWLYRSAHFAASNAVRAERRRRARDEEIRRLQELIMTTEPNLDQLRTVLDRAMGELNERDRDAVALRFYEGRSFADVGTRLKMTEDAARIRVSRALDKLHGILAREGLGSTGATLGVVLSQQASAALPPGLAGAIAGNTMAATGATSSLAGTVFLIMNSTKTAAGLAIVVGLFAIAIVHRQHDETRRAESALAAADGMLEEALRRLDESRRRSQRVQSDLTSLQHAFDEQQAAVQSAAAVAENRAKHGAPGPALPARPRVVDKVLSANPEVRQSLTDWMQGNFRMTFGPFYKAMGFSPEKIDALEKLLLQEDVNMGSVLLSLRPESVELSELVEDLRRLLGDDAFRKMEEFYPTRFVRRVADGLAGNLYDTDSPLTSFQSEQLIRIFAESSPDYQKGGHPFPSMIDWKIALERAKGILSPTQFGILEKQVELLSADPGLWAGMNPLNPGSFGNGALPPASMFSSEPRK